MTAIMRLALLGLALVGLINANRYTKNRTKPKKMQNKLILIGIDGIRHDFYDLARNLPNLFAISRKGVRASMTPPFPSHTISSWTTIMNGLYVESHGMTGHFFNPATRELFKTQDETRGTGSKALNSEEPLWRTNDKQGGTSAVFSWLANGFKAKPKHFSTVKFDYYKNFAKVKKEFMSALEDPDVNFIMFHMVDILDRIGKSKGPESQEFREALEKMDKEILGSIIPLINLDKVNVILTGDHGMVSTNDLKSRRRGANVQYLDDYLDPETYRVFMTGGSATLSPLGRTTIEELYRKLRTLRNMPDYRVFRKDEMPEFLHFRKNRRTPDILVMADKGSLIMKNRDSYKRERVGYHEYDITLPEMGAPFIGVGPAFKEGVIMDKFHMVHLYPLMSHLLGIKPNPNNGSLDTFQEVLTSNFSVGEEEQTDRLAAMSLFKSRGGNNVSGVIYFSQKPGSDTVNVRLRLITNEPYYNFHIVVRESGNIMSKKGCTGSLGRVQTLRFPSAYGQSDFVTTLGDGVIDTKTQVKGISLEGDNSILGRSIVIESNGNLPTRESMVACGVVAAVPSHTARMQGLDMRA